MNRAGEANFDDDALSGLGAYVDQVDRRIERLELAVMDDAGRQLETIAHAVRVPLADLLGRAEREGRVGRYRGGSAGRVERIGTKAEVRSAVDRGW